MLRLSSWFGRGADDPHKDAKSLYQTLMHQSRKPAFFSGGRVDDNFDGRMEVLALHISLVMAALAPKGKTGPVLSQALYDVMVADFDVALREQGLADTGVSRRIKPMAKMVLSRAKSYMDAFKANDINDQLMKLSLRLTDNEEFAQHLAAYKLKTWQNIKDLSVGDIARSKFEFAEF